MARTFLRVRNENLPLRWSCIPENLRYVPRAIGVMDQQPVSEGLEFVEHAHERLRGGALEERPRLGIDRGAEEIVGLGVANIEVEARIEADQFDQLRRSKWAGFLGRLLRERRGPQLVNRLHRLDAIEACRVRPGIEAPVGFERAVKTDYAPGGVAVFGE